MGEGGYYDAARLGAEGNTDRGSGTMKGRLLKYKDEEELEALRDEVKALRRQLEALGGSNSKLSVGGAGRSGVGANQASAVMLEDLYRRARTEIAAEAGAGYGRVSLEALYLLPAEFTNAYQRLFLAALKESPGQTGEANPLAKRSARLLRRGEPNQRIKLGPSPTTGKMMYGEAEVLDRDPDRGGGKARSSGRRHRDHWIVKDESAFRLKERIDGELRDLAAAALSGLTSRAAGNSSRLIQADVDRATTSNSSDPQTPSCPGCRKFLKASWKFCPHCGSRQVESG